jgi:hypothetical protein
MAYYFIVFSKTIDDLRRPCLFEVRKKHGRSLWDLEKGVPVMKKEVDVFLKKSPAQKDNRAGGKYNGRSRMKVYVVRYIPLIGTSPKRRGPLPIRLEDINNRAAA